MWLYTDLLQAIKGERLSCVFSPDGTLISASAAPHCGGSVLMMMMMVMIMIMVLMEVLLTVNVTELVS